jgi:hypothetical protein
MFTSQTPEYELPFLVFFPRYCTAELGGLLRREAEWHNQPNQSAEAVRHIEDDIIFKEVQCKMLYGLKQVSSYTLALFR